MHNELKRILYLEDDPFISEIALLALCNIANYNVLHCSSGHDAIEKFDTFQPDLMLFDVMLPDIDGVQTYDRICENAHARLPIVFMTAKAQTYQQQYYFDKGALCVIMKPFEAGTLGRQLEYCWHSRR